MIISRGAGWYIEDLRALFGTLIEKISVNTWTAILSLLALPNFVVF